MDEKITVLSEISEALRYAEVHSTGNTWIMATLRNLKRKAEEEQAALSTQPRMTEEELGDLILKASTHCECGRDADNAAKAIISALPYIVKGVR